MRRISRTKKLVALGMLFVGISVGYPVRGFAYTVVTVAGETAGTLGFSSAEEELNIYSTRNMYYDFHYNTDGVFTGYVECTFSDFTGKEVAAPVPPGTYKFTLNYRYQGLLDSQDIYWSMFIGFKNYPAIYIYNHMHSYVRIRYGQIITGEITVADMGQTRRLLKVSETDNQSGLVGQMLARPLKVKVVDSGGIGKEGIDVVFTAMPADCNCSFSESPVVKTITVTTLADGTAEVPFKLGDVPETCTVKAVCASCAAGKEVIFTANAIASNTNVTGTVPAGCSQVALGEITAQVDPVTNSFRLPNVPLTITPQVGLLLSELEVRCNNDAECPVYNAQRMPISCAGGAFGASRSGGSPHGGIDLLTENDATPVLSATAGRVIHVGLFNNKKALNKSWGWTVVIQSTRRILNFYEVLLYGHLDPDLVSVNPGDYVSAGQQIAVTGRYTGNLTNPLQCPHVHVERRLLSSQLSVIGVPIPCAGTNLQCNGGDMNSNGNGSLFGNTRSTNPDTEIGCNVYR